MDRLQYKELFEAHGISLSDVAIAQFRMYHAEILRWNSKASLISKKDESRIVERHFLESALLGIFDDFRHRTSVLDLGSGAGFPGIPLKIVCPELRVTLLDSKRRKCLFLNNLLQKLDLANVEVLWARAEALGLEETYRRKFNIIVSRAVTELGGLFKLAEPLLSPTGVLIAMKGASAETEIKNLKEHYPDSRIETRGLPGPQNQKQRIVFIRP